MHATNHIVTASNVTRILVILHVGGKSSGIFGESEPPAQPQRSVPPGGSTSNIFGSGESAPVQSPVRSHPNKPKVGHDASRFFPLYLCVDSLNFIVSNLLRGRLVVLVQF